MLCVCALQVYLLLEVGVARTHLGCTLNGSVAAAARRAAHRVVRDTYCYTPFTRPSAGVLAPRQLGVVTWLDGEFMRSGSPR